MFPPKLTLTLVYYAFVTLVYYANYVTAVYSWLPYLRLAAKWGSKEKRNKLLFLFRIFWQTPSFEISVSLYGNNIPVINNIIEVVLFVHLSLVQVILFKLPALFREQISHTMWLRIGPVKRKRG